MEKEESEQLKQKKWSNSFYNKNGEEVITISPKVVSFECDHIYVDLGKDDEGYYQVECVKCHTGRRYDHHKFEVREGKLCKK